MQQRTTTLWNLEKGHELIDLEGGYFVVRFFTRADYLHVLEGGPWIILGHYLIVMCWRPNFRPSRQQISTTLIWVQLRELPREVFDEESLADMGEIVGRTVKVDPISVEAYTDRYARVCVEIDLGKPLLPSITFLGESQLVGYEGLHLICFACGKYGHKCESCPDKGAQAPPTDTPMVPTPENPYGPWMLPKSNLQKPQIPPHHQPPNFVGATVDSTPVTLVGFGLGSTNGPVDTRISKPKNSGPPGPGPEDLHRTWFVVLDGHGEDGPDLVDVVARLNKQIADIQGPNAQHQPGTAHARGAMHRSRAGKQVASPLKQVGQTQNLERKSSSVVIGTPTASGSHTPSAVTGSRPKKVSIGGNAASKGVKWK